MTNRKPKDTEDILEFVKSKWKLTLQEFDVLESILDIFQASDKREIDKIEHLVNDGNGMGVRQLFRTPVVWLAICLMICSGASELAMAQWASAYAEAALGLSKTFGDLIGPCMFAITMGISRLIFGKYGEKMDLMKFMILLMVQTLR